MGQEVGSGRSETHLVSTLKGAAAAQAIGLSVPSLEGVGLSLRRGIRARRGRDGGKGEED